MIEHMLWFSIRWRYLILIFGVILAAIGLYCATILPIDAIPDITDNQVQINTVAPAFAPQEMEQYVTFPIEVTMSNLPRKQEIRSLSQFGLSQITVTFDDDVDLYRARQLVLERLIEAERELPPGVSPELAPISTGLGEIFQFTLEPMPGYESRYSLTDLRTLLDWVVKPGLRTVPGITEVNSFGGMEKQYEVSVDPKSLVGYHVTLPQVIEALRGNNVNAGGAFLESGGEQKLFRGVGLVRNLDDIRNIVVASRNGTPIYIRNIADAGFGNQVRQGAATKNGQGETVMGMAMLLKGENSRIVTQAVKDRLPSIQKALPEGVSLKPFYDRSDLVNATIRTAIKNLLEGGLLVIGVLFLFLLQLRAGLIVSSAIPISMLFAIVGMKYFEVSANLMSLGAIDFGLIVDAAVIMVENSVRRLAEARRAAARPLTRDERLDVIRDSSSEVRKASQFGEMIIIAAYIPILSLAGIEGKMFRPMAFTVILALSGALVLSFTFIPALSAIFLRDQKKERENFFVSYLKPRYERSLHWTLKHPLLVLFSAFAFFAGCVALVPLLGSEFIPDLDEGALAINLTRLKSVSLGEAVRQTTQIERVLKSFPEVTQVVSRIGRPEIATDPMGPDMGDTYVFLKPHTKWREGMNHEMLVNEMSERLEKFPGVIASFSQPIKFRMMELIEGIGSRSDVVVKIFGDDLAALRKEGNETAEVLKTIRGAEDVKVQQITGLPMLQVNINRDAIARYGINVSDVQEVIQSAIAGTRATSVLEGFRRFDLVVRLPEWARKDESAISNLLISAPNGQNVPLSQVAAISNVEGPAEISRENGSRRISVEANVRGRDIGSFVAEAMKLVDSRVKLPTGYTVQWGGTYENLESGRNRLMIAVPITFAVILILLFTTFNSIKHAFLVFTGIPFAVTGGILALLIRGMHFSMSAGIGFIAVSGVAVLNGVVLVTFINQLQARGTPTTNAIMEAALTRLRPILMTAFVASLGFIPMALSTSTGSEVQRPLATVVIGGLVTSTILTLLVLPAIYARFQRSQ